MFYKDEVDMSITADEAAEQRAIEHRRQMKKLNCTFQWSPGSSQSVEVDMIG